MKQEINKKALLVQQEITAFESILERKYILVWMNDLKTGRKSTIDIGIRQIEQVSFILVLGRFQNLAIVLLKSLVIVLYDVRQVLKLQLINGRNFIQ